MRIRTTMNGLGPKPATLRAAEVGLLFAIVGAALLCTVAQAQNGPANDFTATRTIPVGTAINVIVMTPISSNGSLSGDTVRVRLAPDDSSGVPKGIVFVGHVHEAIAANRNVPGELSLRFDSIVPGGRWQPAGNSGSGPIVQASGHFVGSNGSSANSAVGIGAAAGALIGGSRKRKFGDIVAGGLLGALGGYAVQKATEHNATDITLKSGQEVTITLRHPITLKTEMITY